MSDSAEALARRVPRRDFARFVVALARDELDHSRRSAAA